LSFEFRVVEQRTPNPRTPNAEPADAQFGKLMSISDDLMWRYFELLSFRPLRDIEALRAGIADGRNPRDVKFELARELVGRFHGAVAADAAQAAFVERFSKKSLPDDLPNKGTALELLGPYGVTRETLTCPTDAATARVVEKHGTSYHFSPVLQDETPVSVKIYSRRGTFNIENIGRLTVASDFQPVHPGKPRGINVLKADGRVIQR
jgi:tyrosyl-tRNA synthetase